MEQDRETSPQMQALVDHDWDNALSLIEAGAKVDHKDDWGMTPLHLGSRWDKTDVALCF